MSAGRSDRRTSSATDLRRTARRIGLQTAGLLMVCLLVVGAVVYAAVVQAQDRQLSDTLTTAIGTAGLGGGDRDHDRDLSEPRGGIQYAVIDVRGLRSSADIPAGLPDRAVMAEVARTGASDRRMVQLPSGIYVVLTAQRGDDTVQVIANTFEQAQERHRIIGALGLAGGAGVVIAAVAAVVLARRTVRPMAQALELQRRFVADAGHELRTPLTLLSTRTQLLARRTREETTLAAAERDRLIERDAAGIVADTASLTTILEELLTAADLRAPIPSEPVELGPLVQTVVRSAEGPAYENGVNLSAVISDRWGTGIVAGTPTALTRAVSALVDNAVEHARREVRVGVRDDGRRVVVDVTDDGPGIPTEVLPRMFDRFFSDRTAESGAQRTRRHFGLGLALVSEIATRHGGQVTARNRPDGQGAVLSLTLPRARGHRS